MNARTELESAIKYSESKIVCATITTNCTFGRFDDSSNRIDLRCNYTPEELEKFMEELDFDYDNGYGMQFLGGTVWFENDTWLERGEYDGSEWWELMSRPTIPDNLMKKEGPSLAYGVYNDMNKNK